LSTTQIRTDKRKTVSEILAIVALTLLTIDTTNTLVSTGTHGFLPLTDQQNGVYLGLPSVIMFFLSFGFAFRIKARLTTALLITGGTLLAVSKIVEPIMGSNLYLVLALPYLYYSLIVIGFVLLGIGIFRMIRKQ
jgi:hypothetical protein